MQIKAIQFFRMNGFYIIFAFLVPCFARPYLCWLVPPLFGCRIWFRAFLDSDFRWYAHHI